MNDPLGLAILDFAQTKKSKNIIVHADICEDDIIPSSYLFRPFEEMPIIEREALNLCKGDILDVGAGAGMHANYLQKKGYNVEAIDISEGAVAYMKNQGIKASTQNFYSVQDKKYDTVLLLMNGLGIAGSLEQLPVFLIKAKSLLKPGGKIICDTTDIKYLYEDDEGGMWVDLNNSYYGNFQFQMEYKDQKTEWFPWLYCDQENLQKEVTKCGLSMNIIIEDGDQYLVELKEI